MNSNILNCAKKPIWPFLSTPGPTESLDFLRKVRGFKMKIQTKYLRFSVSPVMQSWRERGRQGLYVYLKLTLGLWELELSNGSLQPWTHFRVHTHEFHRHVVCGRISASFGRPGLEEIRVCSDCYGLVEYMSAGDELWDWCEDCQQIEGPTKYMPLHKYEAYHG